MPGENYTFTTHVDPGSPPQRGPPAQRVVEAPGTAPGSATIIPSSVYRHSRRSPADPANIGGRGAQWKRPIGRHERPPERSATTDAAHRNVPPGTTDTMPIDDHKRAEIEAQRAASQETRRVTVPAMEAILYERFDVLDHGFVRVIDYMGDDAAIVQAARVSYGAGTRKVREDRALIRYLLRHRHTTPFEMCELKLHIKAPIFVARQWLRHRTASVNEYSARYSRLDREFYVPDADHLQSVHEEQIGRQRASSSGMDDLFGSTEAVGERLALATQSDSNKQGRDDVLTDEEARQALSRLDWISTRAYGVYKNLLNEDDTGAPKDPDRAGLARELARAALPVNYYTQFYWKIDLRNLLHFLSLRADAHAQYEIRAYADVILDEIVMSWVPATYQAFRDYAMDAASLSAGGLAVVKRMLSGEAVDQASSGLSKREWRELMAVLGRDP